jgi:hypothetical protein
MELFEMIGVLSECGPGIELGWEAGIPPIHFSTVCVWLLCVANGF